LEQIETASAVVLCIKSNLSRVVRRAYQQIKKQLKKERIRKTSILKKIKTVLSRIGIWNLLHLSTSLLALPDV